VTRRGWNRSRFAGLALLAGLSLMPAAATAAESCNAGRTELYCAEATSAPAVDCHVTQATFACEYAAPALAVGSSDSALPGQLSVTVETEVGVCAGAGLCKLTGYEGASGQCTWGLDGHECGLEVPFAESESGLLDGCLYTWVYQRVTARAGLPGSPAGSVTSGANAESTFHNCE